jgi:hypothetical protein
MKKLFAILLVTSVVGLTAAGEVLAENQRGGADTGVFMQAGETTTQVGLFSPFMAAIPALKWDTAFSVSNTMMAPKQIQDVLEGLHRDVEGTLEFYLWNSDTGEMFMYETDASAPGLGLNAEGVLEAGHTYKVLLTEVLAAAGYDFDANGGLFAGYGWIISNNDGAQGTVNVTDFDTFTQAMMMQPDLSSDTFLIFANAGLPLHPPEEDPGPTPK